MPKTTALANDLLNLVFNGTALSWNANTDLYVSLHTASPGVGGNQTTNEATYTDYARVAVNRDNTGFTVSTNTTTNPAEIEFPQNAGSDQTITHVGIGTAASGAGRLLYFSALSAGVNVETGFIPRIPVGDLDVTES